MATPRIAVDSPPMPSADRRSRREAGVEHSRRWWPWCGRSNRSCGTGRVACLLGQRRAGDRSLRGIPIRDVVRTGHDPCRRGRMICRPAAASPLARCLGSPARTAAPRSAGHGGIPPRQTQHHVRPSRSPVAPPGHAPLREDLIARMQPDIPRVCSELPDTAEAAHHNRLDAGDDHQGPRISPASPGHRDARRAGRGRGQTFDARVSCERLCLAPHRTRPLSPLPDRSLRDLVIRSRIASRSGLDPSSS